MLRFTIRDLLWLMVVVGLAVLMLSDRAALKKERAALHNVIAAERAALKKERTYLETNLRNALGSIEGRKQNLDYEVRERVHQMVRQAMPVPDAEIEAAKRKSAELGAPQPKPLPPGHGEIPNTP